MIRLFRRKKRDETEHVDDAQRVTALLREADMQCDEQDYEKAMKLYKAAAEAGAGSRAYAMFIMLLARMEDPKKALNMADRLISKEPDNGVAYAARATALAHQHKYAEAIDVFTTVARKYSKPKEIYYEMGFSFSCLGRHAEAVEAYRRSIELCPDDPFSFYGLCMGLERLGRYDEALSLLKDEERKTGHRHIHTHLGRVYGKLGDWKNAYASHVKAVWIPRPGGDGMRDRALMKRYNTISEIHKNAKAAKPDAYSLLALALQLLEIDWDENALNALDTSTRMMPTYPTYMMMAEICAKQYFLHSAIKHVESALKTLKKNPHLDDLNLAYGYLVQFSFECGLYRKVLDYSSTATRLGVKNKDVYKYRKKVLSKYGENPEDRDQVSDGFTHPDWL